MIKMTPMTPKTKQLRFRDDTSGSMTIMGMFFFIAAGILGAFALDVTNLNASRTHLQVAADQAAHAAIYNRALMNADDAKERALAVVEATLPNNQFGVALTADDIEFGVYVASANLFVPDVDARDAVRVRTAFLESRSNAVVGYLFRLIGFDRFDVVTSAIYTTYRPACLREGFVAQGVVDIQSNNAFGQGFCIHSNTHVSLNSNNIFEAGTIVSMPDLASLDLPRSGFDTNAGLEAALRSGFQNIRVLSRIDNMLHRYENPYDYSSDYPSPSLVADTDDLPDYITNPTVVEMRERDIETSELEEGRVYLIDCVGNSGLTIDATQTLREVIIISPCDIKFSSGSSIEDARILSRSTASDSISSPSGLRIGRNDNCAAGGGAQLITAGGMRFPSDLQIFGSQLLAKGDIYFAANANGVQGASMIAGGEISGTSNMNMGLCLTGMEDNVELNYFRLAR